MQGDTIQRSALGNPIGLGVLYDTRTERSCNVSILRESPPPANCVTITQIPNTESDYVHVTTASEKFRRLNVDLQLQISVLSGLVSVRGSGKYFQAETTSARSVSVSLIHKITTVYENLSIMNHRIRENINLQALRHRNATHVVTGVTWGANLIVTAEYTNEEKRDIQEVAGKLEAQLKGFATGSLDAWLKGSATGNLQTQPKGSANMDLENRGKADNSKFNLKIVGDVLIPGPLPQTIEGALALVAGLSSRLHECNQRKGVPLRYELTSLKAIQSYFNFSNVQINSLLRSVEDSRILRIIAVFDTISETMRELNDVCADAEKYQDRLPANVPMQIRNLRHEVEVAASDFKGELQRTLVQVRSSEADTSQLEVLKNRYESGPYSASSDLLKINHDFQYAYVKIERLKQFSSLKVSTVSRHVQSLATELLEFEGKQAYVLFGESEAIKANKGLWENHLFVLRTLAQDPLVAENSKFLFVDLDSTPSLRPYHVGDSKVCLQRFNQNGRCADEDAYKTFMTERSLNYAKSALVTNSSPRPQRSTVIALPCPKSQTCVPRPHRWRCSQCKVLIEWDFDGFFYCSCGKGPADSYKFRCSNCEHQNDFNAFSKDQLKNLLDISRRLNEEAPSTSSATFNQHENLYRSLRMGRPLGEILKNIMDNIRLAEEHRKILRTIVDLTSGGLEEQLWIPVSELRVTPRGSDRVVCTSLKCSQYCRTKHGVFYNQFPKNCKGLDNDGYRRIGHQNTCDSCSCCGSLHMLEDLIIEPVDDLQQISFVQDGLRSDVLSWSGKCEKALKQTDDRIEQLQRQLAVQSQMSAKFDALTSISWNYKPVLDYLYWLAQREEKNDMMTDAVRMQFSKEYETFINLYTSMEGHFRDALQTRSVCGFHWMQE